MGVILMFIVSMVFSVLFPTTDVGSDLYLAHQTINFIGDNQVLLGCRTCFHKNEKDIFGKYKNGCRTCLKSVADFSVKYDGVVSSGADFDEFENNETRYRFSFVSSFCGNPIIDKVLELQTESVQCNENFQTRHLFSEVEENGKRWVKSKECDMSDRCCIERVKDLKYAEYDKEIEWINCIRNNRGCEMCLGTGQLTFKSCYYLQDIPDPVYTKSLPIHKQPYPWAVRDRECKSMENTTFYRINNLTINQGEVLHVNYEEGKCLKDDQCCVKFRYADKSDKSGITQCYDDICKLSLYRASFILNKTVDINNWITIDIHHQGLNLGGRLCSSLQTFGWSILIHVLFH
jgi:hypothetical protein